MKARDNLQSAVLEAVNAALDLPVTAELIHRATDARESALRIQETVLATLNLPSATELSVLHGRVRSLSQRLEDIEDSLDELSSQVRSLSAAFQEIPRPSTNSTPSTTNRRSKTQR